jgi:acyl-CoA thioesterase-2
MVHTGGVPVSTRELLNLLDLEVLDQDLFRGSQPKTTWQRTFGGQVLAQSLVAGSRTVEGRRRLHSLHATFLRAGSNDAPLIYDVERMRDGRTFSTRLVRARQHGRVIFTANLSFKSPEEGLDHFDPMPRDLPHPESCPPLTDALERMVGTSLPSIWRADALDVRYIGQDETTGHASHATHMRLWVRTTGTLPMDPVVHQAILAYLSDISLLAVAVMPHSQALRSGRSIAPASVDHGMWFHRPARADEWLFYDEVSPSASDALGFSMGRLMQGGKLVASCSQEGLLRLIDADQA